MNSFTTCLNNWFMFVSAPTRANRRAKSKFWDSISGFSIKQFNQGQPWLSQHDEDIDFDD